MYARSIGCCLVAGWLSTGCATPRGGSTAERQDYVRAMREETLATIRAVKPELASRLKEGAGYAVFSNVNVHVLFLSAGQGYGVVVDNRTGRETFMRMGELGTGFGAGLKDVRVLFLFPTRRDLDQFVEKGWEMGADAEVAAVAGDKGVDAASQASVSTSGQSAGAGAQAVNRVHTAAAKGVEIYQITEAGLALSITLAGTKYWKDSKLND